MLPFKFGFVTLLFVFSFLNCATSVQLYHDCSSSKTFTRRELHYKSIIQNLMTSLSSQANTTTQTFYNTSSNVGTNREAYDTIYGLYMCDGDVSLQRCRECVSNAAQELISLCPLVKEAIIWYDDCLVRFFNGSFSVMDLRPRSPYPVGDSATCSIQERSRSSLIKAMEETATKAVNYSVGANYATKKVNLLESGETVTCLAQCRPDLSSTDCRICLKVAIDEIRWYCQQQQGGVVSPSCFVEYKALAHLPNSRGKVEILL